MSIKLHAKTVLAVNNVHVLFWLSSILDIYWDTRWQHKSHVSLLLFLLSIAERGSHRGPRLGDVHSLLLPVLRLSSRWDVLGLDQTLMLVAPEHEVKEVGNEGGWDVVGRSVLGPAWTKNRVQPAVFVRESNTLLVRYQISERLHQGPEFSNNNIIWIS